MNQLKHKVEKLESEINRGADVCPHLPPLVREMNEDGTPAESPWASRYAPLHGVPADAVCECGRPRQEIHLIYVKEWRGPEYLPLPDELLLPPDEATP